jgi:SAM-dependent methyltransferase
MSKICDSLINCTQKKSVLFEKDGYPVLECIQCGHRFIKLNNPENHVKQVYKDDYFFKGRQGYPNYLNQQDLLLLTGVNYAAIVSKYVITGSVLDVGCAAGFILKGFEQAGWKCTGIEPNDTMAEFGRKKLHLDITTGTLENYKTEQQFDLINIIQVIGHFYDLDRVLLNLCRLLKPGGFVLIESWDMNSIYAKTMGKKWHEYSPPSVVNWFSDKTLTGLFNYYGFELVKKGFPKKKINVKHALSLIAEKSPESKLKNKIINRLNNSFGKIDFPYPPIDLKWYLFKKK